MTNITKKALEASLKKMMLKKPLIRSPYGTSPTTAASAG